MQKKNLEKVLKALANRRRLTLLAYLKTNQAVSVGTIAKELRMPFKTASRNLVMLERVGIVEKEQLHQQRIYRLADSRKQRPFVQNVIVET
jgi:predicted transcriptional regulator